MSKARKIKVGGTEYKYFLDTASTINHCHQPERMVILYCEDGNELYWRCKEEFVDNRSVKRAILTNQFKTYWETKCE